MLSKQKRIDFLKLLVNDKEGFIYTEAACEAALGATDAFHLTYAKMLLKSEGITTVTIEQIADELRKTIDE